MAQDSFQFRLMRYLHEMVSMQILQDFQSQKKAEAYFKVVILTVAVISYAIGDIFQQFSICVYSTLAAMVLCYFVFVPGQAPWWRKPYPQFRPEAEKIKNKKD